MFIPSSYVCPHCGTKTFSDIHPVKSQETYETRFYGDDYLCITECLSCKKPVLWYKEAIVWPLKQGILPVEEMPEDAKEIFQEAQNILSLSPRAACALLRISLELLVNYAGRLENPEGFKEKARLIDRIESLGASAHIKELLHVCRVIGNEYAHPGVINMEGSDNLEMAQILSRLINQLVEIWVKPYLDAQRAKELLGK